MFEALKGLNIVNPGFIIPVIIAAVVLILVVKVAKKLIKLAIVVGLIILAIIVYMNLPSFKVDGSAAVLRVNGQEYRLDPKDMKITSENQAGSAKVFLVSGSTRIELPFSKEYAEKLIMSKLGNN